MKKIVRISSILFVATPLMLLNSPKVEAAQVASIQSNADITFALDNTVTPPVNPPLNVQKSIHNTLMK